ncbi:MAG: M20/M25/M40 family metallo-hydrolase [Pseudomonadota bacterium]|nr:M20/M25/M40 family metallo-hydrolase [Pseudomonadota bacterium]
MSFTDQSERRGGFARRAFLVLGLGIAGFLIAGFLWATSVPGQSYAGPASTPDNPALAARLREHVTILAQDRRNIDRPQTVIATKAYISQQLEALGYSVRQQEVIAPASNLIVRIDAKSPGSKTLILGAHYDTAGSSPGADDNASGVAALIEIARLLKPMTGRSKLNVELVFYANEEPPYFKTGAMGSYVHAISIDDPNAVVGMISLESMGYFSDEDGSQNYPFPLSLRYTDTGNFIAFVGTTASRDFLRGSIDEFRKSARIPSVGGTAPSIVQGVDWSDHWGYTKVGIPAFMITDTAPFRNPNYHRTSDTPDTLDYNRLALVTEGIGAMLEARLSPVESD